MTLSLDKGIVMRIINTVTLSVVALVTSAVATAAEPSLPWQQQSTRPAIESGHNAPLNSTSLIGTGSAAAAAMHPQSMQAIQSPDSHPHARPAWSALIGTGAAAALESGPRELTLASVHIK
jgi:hypothetical protein